jgi:hypothetical protein
VPGRSRDSVSAVTTRVDETLTEVNAAFEVAQSRLQALSVGVPGHSIHTGRRVPLQPIVRLAQQRRIDVVQ